ncbi:MAG: hypothetical protein DMF77_23605 [Acidobacteria bacterium]|nr:MAG: hypothetical protein DMF77_23605 [Acidobacteriota bacterium]
MASDQDRSMQPAGNDDPARVRRSAVNEASTRAPRLPLNLQLRYRSVGAARWHEGRVENISRSGVLFRATDLVDVDVQVEITVLLPVRPSASAIVCRGRIVRTVLPGGSERRPGLAATISRYRFRRDKDGA